MNKRKNVHEKTNNLLLAIELDGLAKVKYDTHMYAYVESSHRQGASGGGIGQILLLHLQSMSVSMLLPPQSLLLWYTENLWTTKKQVPVVEDI